MDLTHPRHLSHQHPAALRWFIWSILLFAAVLQTYSVIKYSVNVPYWDEWLHMEMWDNTLSPQWLFTPHNEHQIFVTKIQMWLFAKISNQPFVAMMLMNLVIYFSIIIVLIKTSQIGKSDPLYFASFLLFLLSPIAWEIHLWAFTSQIELSLLFFFISILFLFSGSGTHFRVGLGIFITVINMFSFSSGVTEGFIILLGYSIYKFVQIRRTEGNIQTRIHVVQLIYSWVFLGVSLLLWFYLFQPVVRHPSPALSNGIVFWRFFLNLISLGFGRLSISDETGLFCLVLAVLPLILGLFHFKGASAVETNADFKWVVPMMTLGILAVLGTIAIARGAWLETAKSSRYSITAMMLIPCTALSWENYISKNRKFHNVFWLALWSFSFFGFGMHWKFSEYKNARLGCLQGIKCINNFIEGRAQSANCPMLFYEDLSSRVLLLQQKGISFHTPRT